MEQGVTWYDVLGVMPGVEARKIKREYEAKSVLLRPDMIAGAPSNVFTAVTRAQDMLDRAWEVLGDPVSRGRYDEVIGVRRSGGGLRRPGTGPLDPGMGPDDLGMVEELPVVAEVGGLLAALAALTGGHVRKPRPPRPVAVPDVRGLFFPACVEVARRHRLQVYGRSAHRAPDGGRRPGGRPGSPTGDGAAGRPADGAGLAPARPVMPSRLASCSQGAADGHRWLLMAVRGHLGDTRTSGNA
jgi:curved DNA-binding protein CbpA